MFLGGVEGRWAPEFWGLRETWYLFGYLRASHSPHLRMKRLQGSSKTRCTSASLILGEKFGAEGKSDKLYTMRRCATNGGKPDQWEHKG